jgi:hypothetical protein
MNKLFFAVIVVAFCAVGATRTVTTKFIKCDTALVIKPESTKVVTVDSFKVVTTLKDTTLVVKIDSTKVGTSKRDLKNDTLKQAITTGAIKSVKRIK